MVTGFFCYWKPGNGIFLSLEAGERDLSVSGSRETRSFNQWKSGNGIFLLMEAGRRDLSISGNRVTGAFCQ